MKIFRFMSIDEFRNYQLGKTLINTTNHNLAKNSRTNSIGFCFFNLEDFKPETAFHFLTGIVNPQICAIFETKKRLKQTYRRYSNLYYNKKTLKVFANYDDMIMYESSFIAVEYSTTKYSKENFKLLKYTIPDWFNKNEWIWIEEEKCKNISCQKT